MGTEAHLTEVIHRLDRLWEPTQRLRAYWLQHESLDVYAHFIPQAVIQLFAAAVLEPAQERHVIETDTGTRNRRAEQVRRNVLTTPIMCPGEATFNKPRVDRIYDVSRSNNSACWQNFDGERPVSQRCDVFTELLQHNDFVS
jgi:hypothetical protein